MKTLQNELESKLGVASSKSKDKSKQYYKEGVVSEKEKIIKLMDKEF